MFYCEGHYRKNNSWGSTQIKDREDLRTQWTAHLRDFASTRDKGPVEVCIKTESESDHLLNYKEAEKKHSMKFGETIMSMFSDEDSGENKAEKK